MLDYNITKYDAEKYINIATVNNFGGKNVLLSVGYLVGAFLCWLMFGVFLMKMKRDNKIEEKYD